MWASRHQPTTAGQRLWEPCINVSGKDIPSCGIVKVKCYNKGTFEVTAPDTDDDPSGLAVVDDLGIRDGELGSISFFYAPQWVRCYRGEESGDSGSSGSGGSSGVSDPECSREWGPRSGSFDLHRDQKGFFVVSPPRPLTSEEEVVAEGDEIAVLVCPKYGTGTGTTTPRKRITVLSNACLVVGERPPTSGTPGSGVG